ncbi:MAG: twitching motility protein, twitching motility protein PilT [candidate division WS6 bacterium GW2011_GWC1_33_20]|uniref:Twitching motility protein, twitching motility protein PilT n=1 Tax=candidate division WS6 bacterium GW2011_GWC1_33_20 TaxID=1619089 RepID=A0A0F9ZJW2_9BACT|nr:MAG: twitching motility protein, twitching motility protein PilT [candidate division WS6 bacterium GW2011_GWE2_33_157]KKP44389.1 MAG: twitching motility protein, twitching motility protein PilT [candidate division WS6 bacterium GW2011_GWC1_33_20]KKP46019.1 MAG: twitching motility protein, twitching motility protein PilT [candidate division WS6 bacterium GW2011_GWF1_33_233]KKP55549.1 MAG: twitching motility protein, twitching motility protein PilT [candidate division WS6 bacterium GW2011_WS6_3
MDNNTAQNGTIGYPNLAQNSASIPIPTPTTPTPVQSTSDAKMLEDLAAQIQKLDTTPQTQSSFESLNTLPVPDGPDIPAQPVQAPIAPAQPIQVPVTPTPPVIEHLVPQPIPVPEIPVPPVVQPVVPEQTVLPGAVENKLEEIIPGEKVPKALQRKPVEDSVAKPIDEPVLEEIKSTLIDEDKDEVEAPVKINQTQKIDELLRYAIEHEASDLHISVGYPPIVRIDGELKEISDSIITAKDAEDFVLPLLSDEKKELLQVNKEIDFAYFYNKDLTGRFRINAFYTMKNLAAAFRLIPTRIRTIDELLLPQLYHQFSQLKQGLILVTGPTGHGKSTTLAAILEEVNTTRFSHIITIEDPIEYVFEGKKALIEQREMNDDTHSWSIALRSALRQDPDVILVGEMRDYETIASAITLAETGHLVFATLHTNNAAQTVDRIIDVFPNNQQAQIRLQLSNILEAIVAQRLIPLDKGGRRAVSEIMVASPAIRNMIREAKTHQIDNVIRTSSDIGMVSLEKSLVGLIREGVISVQRAQEYAVFPEEVLRLLKS